MKAKAVLFDLDDTLYEYAPCNGHGLAAAREVLGGAFEIPEQEFHALHDEVRGQLARELRGQAASHNRALFFKRMVEAVAGGPHPAAADLVRADVRPLLEAFFERMQPQADAPEVLAALKASRPLVLVSNHTALPQLGKIAALGSTACSTPWSPARRPGPRSRRRASSRPPWNGQGSRRRKR